MNIKKLPVLKTLDVFNGRPQGFFNDIGGKSQALSSQRTFAGRAFRGSTRAIGYAGVK
jgi:hypothetical protein